MSRQVLAHLQLHLIPPPRNISESRAILRAMERFGEINMFKVLRFEETTKELTPKAHLIYKHSDSASALLAAGPVAVPSTDIIVTPSESIFRHDQYIGYTSTMYTIRNEAILAQRKVTGRVEVEVEDESTRFGSDTHMIPSAQTRDMKSRLLKRFLGGFMGFNDLAENMRIEAEQKKFEEDLAKGLAAEKLKAENERLARGEDVDLSDQTIEEVQKDQLFTIQNILSDLDQEAQAKK